MMNKINIGWVNGLIGVIIFAGSMPATRVAVADFSPEFLTGARATIAAIFGLICLIMLKQQLPRPHQYKSLLIVALTVVIGFPLLTAFALQSISAARSLVFVALLPLCTAVFGVLSAGEKPSLKFWLFTLLGSSFVIVFMFNNDSTNFISQGDLYMIAAIIACGFGYAEGGYLSKTLGGWQVICWALSLALPFMLIFSLYYTPHNWGDISYSAYAGLFYVSIFSMLIGFFYWYKGLAMGGIAKVGQIQLIQPFFGLMLCAIILGETVSFNMILVSVAVIICVICAKKFA